MKKRVYLILMLVILILMACDVGDLDYTGTWVGTFNDGTDIGDQPFTMIVTHTGTTLTGSGDFDGSIGTLSGTVGAGSFNVTCDFGDSGNVAIVGIFTSETSASGTYSTTWGESGTFSVVKQ